MIDRAGNISDPETMEFEVQQLGPNDSFVPPPIFDASNRIGQADFPLESDDLVGGDDDDGGRN